jgi:hypothetical protein
MYLVVVSDRAREAKAMLRKLVGAVVLTVSLAASFAVAAPERGWVIQASGGSIEPSSHAGLRSGKGAGLAALYRVQPWFLVGGEFAGWGGMPHRGYMSIPEVRVRADDARAHSLSAVVRVQPPTRVGPAPFALLEAGYTRFRWGDVHYDGSGFGYPSGVERGEVEWGSRMAIGIGLRLVLPGEWPDPEASARAVTLGLERQANFAEYRYSLTW